jgi:nucleoside-diphosphate-sugar epimerase
MKETDNQWPVNFNWPLRSFELHIRGVRHLIDLSVASAHNAHITFISSVSAVGSWKGTDQVPEKSFPDLNMAAELGYGQSKLIAEVLLEKAAQISQVRSACCRVGIVAGPVQQRLGLWNKHEYIPSVSALRFIPTAKFEGTDGSITDHCLVSSLGGISGHVPLS